ncbi:hypothetical protein SEA_KEELAN_133 [Gordonia phage Keelan]|nr:hypothetical protein SEA_KEELAN_133 [Gordonia phage Keelan]
MDYTDFEFDKEDLLDLVGDLVKADRYDIASSAAALTAAMCEVLKHDEALIDRILDFADELAEDLEE